MPIKDSSLRDVIKLLFNFGYRQVGPLAKGGFATVLSAVSPDQQLVAVKMIKKENCWDVEEKVWPTLRHKNVLPLIEKIDVEELGLKLFVMPMYPIVLHRVISSKSFLNDTSGLLRVKRWLVDILEGIQYLHLLGYAHLDIKNDNVLIAHDDRAVLCDYSGLNFINVPLERLCAPKVFRPPEYFDELLRENIEGAACDIWLFGLLSLNILTGNWPSLKMGKVTDDASWKSNVESVLIEALKASSFCRLMKSAFPSVPIATEELLLAHHFVTSILKWDQKERPSVQQIMGHPFLTCFEFGDSLYISNPEEIKTVLTGHLEENWIDPNTVEKVCYEKVVENDEKEIVGRDHQPINGLQDMPEKERAGSPDRSNQVLDSNLEKTEVGEIRAKEADICKESAKEFFARKGLWHRASPDCTAYFIPGFCIKLMRKTIRNRNV